MNTKNIFYSMLVLFATSMSVSGCEISSRKNTLRQTHDTVMNTMPKGKILEKESDSAVEVKARVKEIYDYICKIYNDSDEGRQGLDDIEQRFCSESWKKEADIIKYIDAQKQGEIGLWNYDFWIQGQDWEKITYKDIKITDVINKNVVRVELTLHNMRDHRIGLVLVKEHNNWFIDDLIDASNPDGIRKRQVEYIAKNQ